MSNPERHIVLLPHVGEVHLAAAHPIVLDGLARFHPNVIIQKIDGVSIEFTPYMPWYGQYNSIDMYQEGSAGIWDFQAQPDRMLEWMDDGIFDHVGIEAAPDHAYYQLVHEGRVVQPYHTWFQQGIWPGARMTLVCTTGPGGPAYR